MIPTGDEAALLRDTFAAISAGRVDTLRAHSDPELAGAQRCTGSPFERRRRKLQRESFAYAVGDVDGQRIELLGILHENVQTWNPGDQWGTCITQTAWTSVDLEIAVAIGGRETIVEIELEDVGGRWLLERTYIMTDGQREALAMMDGFAREMCDCTTRACATRVDGELALLRGEAERLANHGFGSPPHYERLENTDEVTRYRACRQRW